MKKAHFELRSHNRTPQGRSSSGNLLAKRLYRNNSLSKLAPLNTSVSLLGSLNTSLIPSVSLRKLVRLDHSPPSIQISQGKIHLRRPEDLSALSQTGPLLKKKAAMRKFEKIDSVTEKGIIPEDLKADITLDVGEQGRKFKPSRKWLAKLKQGRQTLEEKLTPSDFIQLMEEEGGLGNEFCYLQKGEHPYDLRIVEFGGVTGDEYITISARGVTYFNWEGSRFVSLEEWRREAYLFERLMKLQFFGKYRLHKNFSNWKKYSRKIGMKKTTDKLKAELLVHDRHLRSALLATRELCCRMQKETYCCFDDAAPALPFNRFKAAQEAYLEQQFQRHLNEIQEEIKSEVGNSLGISMRDFKEENKISSGKEAKGLPLLIGDEKNLEMPYTKEATLRVQQEKFKRFLKLVELLVVHSKVAMMNEATQSTARKLAQQNQSYKQYLGTRGGKDSHFKGKQYIQCQLVVDQAQERSQLRPSKEELTNFMEDIVNKSIIKLVRNHHHIINDPDINAILYQGAEEPPKDTNTSNTLKAILGAEEKQEDMVASLTRSISTSYDYLQDFSTTLAPLVAQYFRNQSQSARITSLSSSDFFTIRQWIERWRKELQEMSKLSEQHESAVFVLNFKMVKEMAIQSCNLCISRMKEVVPKILESALRKEEAELKESLRLMQVAPIGIEIFIAFQQNKVSISAKIDQFDQTLGEIGQLIEILKELGSSGETAVLRGSKQRKQLAQTLKALRGKLQQAQMHSKVHETYAIEQVRKMLPKVGLALHALYIKTKQPRVPADEMCTRIEEWAQELQRVQEQLQKLKDYQRFLGMEDISEDSLRRFSTYFQLYSSIWTYRRRLDTYHQSLLESEWRNIDLQSVKGTLEAFLEQSQTLKKEMARSSHDEEYQIEYLDQNVVSAVVGDIKKKIRPLVEAIQCLRDGSLEEREQKFIRFELQKREKTDLSALVVQRQGSVAQLMQEGIIQQLDFLKKIVFKSKKQVQLNSKMSAVSRFWGESASHSSKSLIDDFSQHYWLIAEQIEEKITVINCVREDPQIEEGEFKNRVQTEKNMFDSLRLLLGEWQRHHNFLAYFQPIFANAYWKGSSESKAYAYAESNWKKLTKQISKDFSLRKLATQEKKHLTVLRENNAIFQQLKFAVETFLNAKRQAFPKLYFLSDEELLHLLLQDKDYASIDKHLSRVFPNLKSLELNEERNCPTAVRNLVDQCLTLRPSPAKQVLQLQQGLRVIEQRMRQGIRSGLLKCSNYYMQDDFNRGQWIRENILQVLLFIGSAEFTKLLEYDYLQPEGEDPAQLLTYQLTQIKQIHGMIREDLHSPKHLQSNYKLSVLLMQAGHFRDIILKVIQLNVTDDSAYEWLREVRSYYNGIDVAVTKYLTRAVDYGYEFVCANYSFTLGTLSERQIIEVVNTAGLGYVPVLHGSNQVIQALCNWNARSYFSLSLKPGLSASFIQNICQGALSSNTYLQLSGVAHLSESTAAAISSFIFEARSILERREAFHLASSGKNGLTLPSFNICFRINHQNELKPIQEQLKVNFRTVKVPQLSITAYLHCITQLAFFNIDAELASKIEKVCEIVNSCCGFQLMGLEEVRSFVVNSFSQDPHEFKQKLVRCMLKQINAKFVNQEEIRFYEGIVGEVLLGTRPEEGPKGRGKQEWDSKALLGHIAQSMKKRQACILVGPSYLGKTHLILQASKACGVQPFEVFHTDLLPKQPFLGSFEQGLWKEGILSRHLKRLTYSQEQWLIFQGDFGAVGQELVNAAIQGKLLQLNGETLYLSPNWKFLFSTNSLKGETVLPQGCELIVADKFSPFDEELHHLLQTRIAKYFKSNVEGFGTLKNLCINNFQKILKFRLKGRFLRAQHILSSFMAVLESLLAKCPEKQLEQKQNQTGVEKLFLWCIFWTVHSGLNADQAKKFESQLFEQIKIEFDRSQPLAFSKFQFDSPQGSLRRVERPVAQLNGSPFLVSEQMEATSKLVQMLVSRNRHVLLVGQQPCGKSQFLAYLKESLGSEHYSFLKIRLSRGMNYSSFEELLYRKAKKVVNAAHEKHLCALNGKQLVVLLDDFNLLQQGSQIGVFLRSILSFGYYHDALTLQKIHLSNVAVLAAESSSYQFNLSYELTKCFQPICLSLPPLREAIQLFRPLLNPEYSAQLCHNIASLHEFALLAQQNSEVYMRRCMDLPCRIVKLLRSYQGKENIVKVWQYISMKLYLQSNPYNESFRSKITAQIKNYSNLMLKNNQQQPTPIQNQQNFIKDLIKKFPGLFIDDKYADYYVFVAMLIQLGRPFSLFTLNQPICPSQKEEILASLCSQFDAQFMHPFRGVEIAAKALGEGKVLVYISDSDANFDELVNTMLNEGSESFIYLVDFGSEESWRKTMEKHPSIIHFACRYFKERQREVKLDVDPELLKHLNFWLGLIEREDKVSFHSQQEICRVIKRNRDKLHVRVDEIIINKQKVSNLSKQITKQASSYMKQLEQLKIQLQQMVKGEEKKRRDLLQLKNSYQGQLTEQVKVERNEKIQSIEIELNQIMSQRRVNEDRMRNVNQQIHKIGKIAATIVTPIAKIEDQLSAMRTIKDNISQIQVFFAIVQYFYTRGEKRYEKAIQNASTNLPLKFQLILQSLFNCSFSITQKYGVLWVFCDKSMIVEDQTGQMAQLLEKRYKNVHIIRQMKDLQDVSQLQQGKAYIFIGEMRSEAAYVNDVANLALQKQKLKKEESKERQQRFVREQKEERPDYGKNIYFIYKQRQRQEKPTKENIDIPSAVSVKSKQLKQQAPLTVRRGQRKDTRMNTLRNTLTMTTATQAMLKKEEARQALREKGESGSLKQEATIRIRYKQSKETEGYSKVEHQYQDYLIVNLQNEIYHSGGKRITSVESKFHKNIANVTFICRKHVSQNSREFVHKYQGVPSEYVEQVFEQILEGVDPHQTSVIGNLEQQHEKIVSKAHIQEKIILERLVEDTTKSLAYIAHNSDFIQNVYQNVRTVQLKLTEAKRQRSQPYQEYFKFCMIWKDYEPLLREVAPYFRMGRQRIKSLILGSSKYKQAESEGEICDLHRIDESESMDQFKRALIKEVIINQSYIQSLHSICLLAILLQIKQGHTDKIYLQLFVQVMKNTAQISTIQKTLDQKECSKQLGRIFESYLHSSNDIISHCHDYLFKRMQINLEIDYYQIKSQWQQLEQSLIAVANTGADPFAEQLAQKDSLFIKQNSDHSKCLQAVVERNFRKLVLVNFWKEESYTKVLLLVEELQQQAEINVILLFTSMHAYQKCAFLHKISQLRIVMIEQNRSPHKHLANVVDKYSKSVKGEYDKIVKFVLFYDIHAYLKERNKFWNEGTVIQNACFYNFDLFLSLLAEAKTQNSQKIGAILNDAIFAGREDLLKQAKKWVKKEEEEALGKTYHGQALQQNALQANHFIGTDLNEVKNQLTSAISCKDFAKTVFPYEDRKQLSLDMFYAVQNNLKSNQTASIVHTGIEQEWSFVDSITFESFKTLETNSYKRESEIFKYILRQFNLRNYLQYKQMEHQIKALKSTDRNIILTTNTQTILRQLKQRKACFGMNSSIQASKECLQYKITYFQELFTSNTPLKRLNLQYLSSCPHIVNLYLYSINKKSNILVDQIFVKVVTEKDEKERGWLLGEVQLNNCKYDPIKNCLQINDKNEIRNIAKVALVLAEKEPSTMQTLTVPLFFQGRERFKMQISSKLRDEGGGQKERVFGILKNAQ